MHRFSARAALTAVLAVLPAAQVVVAGGMYSKASPVLQVDARSYGRLIAKSNHTSIVEFYAPWCGHCQSLKPAYEKAARNLDGLAKVAAIDCDDDANKAFCGSMGVQGFPTLKIVRPSAKAGGGGKPVVEDYQGPRTAKAIVDAVVDKINNHVTRLADKDVDAFLAAAPHKPKLVLFTDKGTTSALLKSLAIDFLDAVAVGQIRSKEKAAVEKYGIEKFPTVVLFPSAESDKSGEPIVYGGELKKKALVEFLSDVAQPNPDPAPTDAAKGKGAKDGKKDSKAKASSTKGAASCPNDASGHKASGTGTGSADEKASAAEPEQSPASSSPPSASAPADRTTATPDIVPIATVTAGDMLVNKCLRPKSYTCVLALMPSEASEQGAKVVASLSQLNSKYLHGKRHLFPFLSVPGDVDGASALREALQLGSGVELVVVNARRGWWRRYEGDFGVESVESWIDAIRMGDGQKTDLPGGVVVEQAEETSETMSSSSKTAEATEATEPTAEAETAAPSPEGQEKIVHEEL